MTHRTLLASAVVAAVIALGGCDPEAPSAEDEIDLAWEGDAGPPPDAAEPDVAQTDATTPDATMPDAAEPAPIEPTAPPP